MTSDRSASAAAAAAWGDRPASNEPTAGCSDALVQSAEAHVVGSDCPFVIQDVVEGTRSRGVPLVLGNIKNAISRRNLSLTVRAHCDGSRSIFLRVYTI